MIRSLVWPLTWLLHKHNPTLVSVCVWGGGADLRVDHYWCVAPPCVQF